MTTYQKLKAENERLKQNIRTLVLNPNSMDAIAISLFVKLEIEFEKAVFAGDIQEYFREHYTETINKIMQ